MRYLTLVLWLLLWMPERGGAQILTRWLDSTGNGNQNVGYFFSNRPLKKSEEGVTAFRNRWTRQTGNLYFCTYDYETGSIQLKYQAGKTGSLDIYPTEPVQDNFFYSIYENLVVDKGVQSLIFVIPGYGKTFKQQLNDFMFRIDRNYTDSMGGNMAIVLFAWGDQSVAPFYHKGRRAANRAANDFSIFQHMLEDFQTDTTYMEAHPAVVSYSLLCTSMGNQLLKRYLIKREKQDIGLVRTYDRIIMIGSDAACDSFEEGKGFDNISEMADRISILVNRIDGPLYLSQYMNMKIRLGRSGPTNLYELPDNIKVYDVTGVIDWKDLPAMGHDYLLRNQEIRNQLIQGETTFQNMKNMQKNPE